MCTCGWYVVCVKVQTQRVALTGYRFVGVSYFCYIILFLYVYVTIAKEQNIIIACRGKWIEICLAKTPWNPDVVVYIPWIRYIYNTCMYLALLYNSSNLDNEHSPYYIALDANAQSGLVTTNTVMIYIYIYIYIYIHSGLPKKHRTHIFL